MNALKAVFRLRSWEGVFNNIISSFLLMVMMLLVVTNVAGRYLFDITVHGTLEITEFIMVAIVYFTFAHTQAVKAHIRVELLVGVLSRRMKIISDLVIYIFGLVFTHEGDAQAGASLFDRWRPHRRDHISPLKQLRCHS